MGLEIEFSYAHQVTNWFAKKSATCEKNPRAGPKTSYKRLKLREKK